MALRRVELGQVPGRRRGEAVVLVSVRGPFDSLPQCLDRVLAHTPTEVPVLVSSDRGGRVGELLANRAARLSREVLFLEGGADQGFVASLNSCFAMTANADVVMLDGDCEVADGWFDGLREAAYSDSTIATATPLTDHGPLLSVVGGDEPPGGLPGGWALDDAAAAIGRESKRLRPRIPTLIGHCAYVKRSALDLVGGFDPIFSDGASGGVDFAQRCLLAGLTHVVADDVLVLHHGSLSSTAGPRATQTQREDQAVIARRYPYYEQALRAAGLSRTGPLARSLAVAARALNGLSVTIDASCLGPHLAGTQVHALQLIQALHRLGGTRLRVALPSDCGAYARAILEGLDGLETLVIDDEEAAASPTDVVHRPFQVSRLYEFERVGRLGEHVVITQQDLIAYRNPGYFDDFGDWQRYRGLARAVLTQADRVVFFSQHAAGEAAAEDLVDPGRSRVVYIGVDHDRVGEPVRPERPAPAQELDGRAFMLCLGVDFVHKNRLFALRVLEQLQLRHQWSGSLVLAGPHTALGSSAREEAEFLRGHPAVAGATTALGSVTEGERRWLLDNASLVISPATCEGFGLVPFEAAAAGVPPLFAPQASLAEVLPPGAALIEPWDPVVTADRAAELLSGSDARDRLVQSIRQFATRYTWDATARQLVEVYREAAAAPARDPGPGLRSGRGAARADLEEPLLPMKRVIRTWRTQGLLRGTWLGCRSLGRRVRRRFLVRPSGPTTGRS